MVVDISKPGVRAPSPCPDFRGAGEAAASSWAPSTPLLWNELQAPASSTWRRRPLSAAGPQTPQDFKPPQPQLPPCAPRRACTRPLAAGPLADRLVGSAGNATYLAFGYTAVKDNQLVLFGWFYNVTQNDISNAQVIGKLYFGSIDDKGARKVAQEFAADILKSLARQTLAGTNIVSCPNGPGQRNLDNGLRRHKSEAA